MTQTPINLAARINGNGSRTRGGPADFPVSLKPVSYHQNGSFCEIPDRLAVVREDTGETLAIVSERYTLIPHPRILNAVEGALGTLNVGPVPSGIYVDRRGARMRALFKFPELIRPVQGRDTICPCLKIENTYDGTTRITVHIGAFRFVCTNLAVGGGGVFAGGFMAVHQGEIPIEDVAKQLTDYLRGFDTIAALYRSWSERRLEPEPWEEILDSFPRRPAKTIRERVAKRNGRSTVWSAYNEATHQATHGMRSYRGAFDLLERVNRAFQERFPLSE